VTAIDQDTGINDAMIYSIEGELKIKIKFKKKE